MERTWLSIVEEWVGQRFEPKLTIGSGTRLGRDLCISCSDEIVIGENVLGADHIFIGDSYHDYRNPELPVRLQPMSTPKPIRIGDGAFLGINVIVLPGVTIGDGAYVGAGAVVTSDVPARSVAVGNPARVIKRWDPDSGEWR